MAISQIVNMVEQLDLDAEDIINRDSFSSAYRTPHITTNIIIKYWSRVARRVLQHTFT